MEFNCRNVPLGHPQTILRAGDKGKKCACFAHIPLGGTLIIYLPQKIKVLISEEDRIIAGETLIATI